MISVDFNKTSTLLRTYVVKKRNENSGVSETMEFTVLTDLYRDTGCPKLYSPLKSPHCL